MHEDAPKMSVAQSLAASTSQPKSDVVTDVPEFVMSSSEPKSSESIDLDLKIDYLDHAAGKYLPNRNGFPLIIFYATCLNVITYFCSFIWYILVYFRSHMP